MHLPPPRRRSRRTPTITGRRLPPEQIDLDLLVSYSPVHPARRTMPCPQWYELGRSPCHPNASKSCLCGKAAAVANGELSAARALTVAARSAAQSGGALPRLSLDGAFPQPFLAAL
jgi:hypothetical protein